MSAPPRTPWMVPRRRDPHFVGRQEELAALQAALGDGGTSVLSQPASVHGLGGVGKTLLAVEFAYQYAADYAAVLWLSAQEPTVLAAAFADLARELGLPEADEPDQGVRTAAVLRWLESPQSGRWLLVFDNAERRQDVEPYVPRRHAGHVLITSRAPDWAPLARTVRVRPLPRAQSVALLRQGLEGGDDAEAGRLAEALGNLPLALAQAAAFVRRTGCTFAVYLARFEARGAEFDRVQGAAPGYGRTVGVALDLALDRLRQGQESAPQAETLLECCAFYAPEHIPRDLLADVFPEAVLDEAIGTLRGYALLDTQAGSVSIHRLVQWAIRERMTADRQAERAERTVRKLRERFPEDGEDVRQWPACRQLLNHALVAAEHASRRQVAGPLVGELLSRIGIYLWSTRALAEAHKQLRHALRILEAAYGSEHPEVARTLNMLGNVTLFEGDLSAARALYERALRLKEAAYGPEHPEVARTLGNLGIVARQQGDLSGARALLERAMHIEETAYGPEHPEVASTLGNLGNVALLQGDLPGARALQERALRVLEAAHGPEHPEVARTLGNLGNVAQQQGDLSGARALQERALRLKEAAYGPQHPAVASTLGNLGNIARDQGNLSEARALQERALRLKEAAYGTEHPAVAITLGDLGLVAQEQEDLSGARALLKRALQILEAAHGAQHPDVATTLTNLGRVLTQTGEWIPAAALVHRALGIFQRTLGKQHPQTTKARRQLRRIEDLIQGAKPAPLGGNMMKVLFLAANPAGTTPLALDEEIRKIDAKIQGARHRDQLTLLSHWAVRLDDLSGILMRQQPHVLHFSGHGDTGGEIVLTEEDGSAKPVPPQALAEVLRVLRDNVRVVVLNACYSATLARALVKVIDCAVGMSDAIDDDHAIAFAAEFYQALAFGKSVQQAFDLGAARLLGEGVARGLVKLHKRRGVHPAEIVLVGAGPEREAAAEPPAQPAGAVKPGSSAATGTLDPTAQARPGMPLTGTQVAQLTDALVAAFTLSTLEEMVRVRLDKSLGTFVSLSLPLREVVFRLLQVAEREGWTQELIAVAHQVNPGNAELRRFWEQHGRQVLSGQALPGSTVPPP
jgi:Tfp pilus assembly protein PilF